jgi:monofunctional biosynthetic peptidoglycan transglycosylase
LLFDFRAPDFLPWRAVDDRVMGGASRSALASSEAGSALFEGEVVLAGGGFASVRSAAGLSASPGASAVSLCVRGDGRRYKLALRTDAAFDGPVWQAPFEAASEWQVLHLSFTQFVPTFRGRPLGPAGGLEAARITSCGLVLADGRGGPFRLELAWIAA